jgi:hypothetical protein
MQRLAERFPARRLTQAAAAAALLGSYPVLIAAAVLPAGQAGRRTECWVFLAASVASYLAEGLVPGTARYLHDVPAWLRAGAALRWAIREIALIVLLARLLDPDSPSFAAFAAGLIALYGLRAIYSAQVIWVRQRRRLPVVTRNLDLGALRIPDPPPQWLITDYTRRALFAGVLPVTGGLMWALTGSAAWGLASAALALAAAAGICAVMFRHVRRNRHLSDTARPLAVVLARVQEYQPEVVLYFSGERDSMYQVNMWLSPLAALRRPAMIILRERQLVPLLGKTSLPVVCLDKTVDLLNFSLPSVRVVLYPANTAKNLHLLRLPGIGHVFVGHGDSDKTASFNPFSKAYDEVWVAGKAGRDRYLRAQVGVRDESIVEVSRPQLTGLATATERPADRPFTVLYAPTWEGWIDDQVQSSLMAMGQGIIQALLDQGVRVLYKPHPLTGFRDARAAAAHQALASLIQPANGNRDKRGRAGKAGASAPAAAAELSRLAGRIRELTSVPGAGGQEGRPGRGTDEAALSRDSRPHPAAGAELAELTAAWHAAYWKSQDSSRHRVVTGPLPALYECFNQADLLISDISSVVADFIATGKPYVVTNPGNLGEDAFRKEFPTAAAAYLLSRDCAGLPGIIGQVAAPGVDALAAERQQLKTYLLGPDSPDALTRFVEAVDKLTARVSALPGQDMPPRSSVPAPGVAPAQAPGRRIAVLPSETGAP